MPDVIKLKIASPERKVFEDEVQSVTLPTKMGEITLLPHHIPLVSTLIPGEVLIRKGGEEFPFAISGGFVEVNKQGIVILADTAEHAEEIDEKRAEEAKKRAETILSEKKTDAVTYATLAAKLEKELARLKVARKRRRRTL